MLPLIVVALVLPAFVGFALGGTAPGVAAGALTFVALIVIAARSRHRGPIEVAGAAAGAPVLALALAPIEDAATANRIATLAEAADTADGPAVLVLAPSQPTRTQRWLSDEAPGRLVAQERLAVSLATLAAAGTHAEGRVVSEDPLQALEDSSSQYGASRVVFVTAPGADEEAVIEARERLDRPIERVEVPASSLE